MVYIKTYKIEKTTMASLLVLRLRDKSFVYTIYHMLLSFLICIRAKNLTISIIRA